MIPEPGQLTYFLSEKEVVSQKSMILLISLAGPLNRATAPTFEKLIEEVEKKAPGWVVLTMREVGTAIERTQFPLFAKLQKIIRDKGAELKLCSVHPELKNMLVDAGVIRIKEVVNNLQDALQSLTPRQVS